jgi:hypothetical protein
VGVVVGPCSTSFKLSYLDGSLQSNDLYCCIPRLSLDSAKESWSLGSPNAFDGSPFVNEGAVLFLFFNKIKIMKN